MTQQHDKPSAGCDDIITLSFDLLRRSTSLSLKEYTRITRGQYRIEASLARHMPPFSTVLFGAFSRKTMVSPLAGNIVDMLVVLADDLRDKLPSRVFHALLQTLQADYPQAEQIPDRNVLLLPLQELVYKIQPAFAAGPHNYLLPAEKFNEWSEYRVHAYKERFEQDNLRHGGRLADIIRMVKTWNRVNGHLFSGYYLELLVSDVLREESLDSYAHGLRTIFQAGLSEVAFKKVDPANPEFEVEGLKAIDTLIGAMKLFKRSWLLADAAIQAAEDGHTKKALQHWRRLFPDSFPTDVDLAVAQTRQSRLKGADALRALLARQQTGRNIAQD